MNFGFVVDEYSVQSLLFCYLVLVWNMAQIKSLTQEPASASTGPQVVSLAPTWSLEDEAMYRDLIHKRRETLSASSKTPEEESGGNRLTRFTWV